MADNDDISAKVAELLDAAAKSAATETSDNYAVLKERLEELESLTRKSFVSHMNYGPVVDKLQKGNSLSDDELKTLRAMIVGAADYYLKYDDDFARSKAELAKVLDQIRPLQTSELDADTLMHLGVLCREAESALIPTAYYLEQKESAARFEAATHGAIDRNAAGVLVRIIRGLAAH
jgi:hypothetical protein